jgi:flagellar protein FliS
MPSANTAYSTYKNIDLRANTSEKSPSELIVMLYDSLCAHLRGALLILENKELDHSDWEKRLGATERFHKSTAKAVELITALQQMLDFERGEPLASQLNNTYLLIRKGVWSASQEKSQIDMEKMLTACSELRTAWKSVAEAK